MKQNNNHFSIKAKLISATAMLLVATIMVVSSSYAWFTLSTAPEVSGVSTAVGANGALEMLLATKNETGEWVYRNGSVSNTNDRNTYWGNLVDLSGAQYGSQAITLFPSTINLNGNKLNLNNPLKTPIYGADGRVGSALAETVVFGKYNGSSAFLPGTNIEGFRGLGVVSGLTERQQGFRAALSAMATAQYNAQKEARLSLSTNGTPLANIAILKAMNGADDQIFDQEDVDAIGNMISGVETALKEAETAYIQAIIAYSLSSAIDHANDDAALAVAAAIRTAADISNATLNQRLTAVFGVLETQISATATQTLTAALNGYATYTTAVENVNKAKTAHGTITTADKYSWNTIREALTPLVNVSNIKVNDIVASQVNTEENKNKIASDILGSKGVWVDIPTGGGVYADIADLAGNYTVDIEINSNNLANGMVSGLTIAAKMNTKSTVSLAHLSAANTAISAKVPGGEAAGNRPLTELYGYVIDLAFRTNAAQSNLLLQTDAADRIYKENNNAETMGSGSTMTFKSSDISFTNQKVKELMSNIRVVFYNTKSENSMADIYATAKLDLVNGVVEDAAGVTAKLYLYENATATKATYNDGTKNIELYKYDGKYYTSTLIAESNLYTIPEGAQVTDSAQTVAVEVRDNVITPLNQGEKKHLSAMVYLEGETIENDAVAAAAAQTMSGTVNFQFASSANLVPMEYGTLHTIDNAQN